MDIRFVFNSIRKQFRSHGLVGVFEMLFHRAYIRYREWKYGIRTEAVIFQAELGQTNPEFHEYGAADWRQLTNVLQRLHLQYPDHVFVDFGAGMGRALIIAGRFPFRRVIGVELSAQLTSIAEQNLKNARAKLACAEVAVMNADATTLSIEDTMTIFYFNNPFHGRTLDIVLSAIHTSLITAPRQASVICRLPPSSEFETQIMGLDWLRRQDVLTLRDGTKYWTFTSSVSLPVTR